MTPFPLGLDSPGKRLTSTRENRDPSRLLAIIAEHHFRGSHGHIWKDGNPVGRYTPYDVDGKPGDETWCNLFAQDVSEAMSVMIPRYTRANELVAWLGTPTAATFAWETVPAHVAQRMADEGQLALVGWVNPSGPGHIAVLVPSLGEAGTFIAQAGGVRFTRGTVAQGFGGRAVTYFAHP